MDKAPQDNIIKSIFDESIEREELLLKKYSDLTPYLKNSEYKEIFNDFKKVSKEHLKLVKDKMIKLRIN